MCTFSWQPIYFADISWDLTNLELGISSAQYLLCFRPVYKIILWRKYTFIVKSYFWRACIEHATLFSYDIYIYSVASVSVCHVMFIRAFSKSSSASAQALTWAFASPRSFKYDLAEELQMKSNMASLQRELGGLYY